MKTIKQVSVALPNKPGMLSKISDIMGDNGINIIGLFVKNMGEQGLLHFICNDPDKAFNVLQSFGYEPEQEEVIACEAPHHPGGLNAILKPLKQAEVNVEYLYSFLGGGEKTILILGLDKLKQGAAALEKNWIQLYGAKLYSM